MFADTEAVRLERILDGAYELVRRGWTQRANARNASDEPVSAHDPGARKFCMIGACHRARELLQPGGEVSMAEVLLWRRFADEHLCGQSMSRWNDQKERTQAEVLLLLRQLREAARAL